MGVKKSPVCTSAWSDAMRYTPASSARSKPTRTLGSCCRANFPSTVSSAAGLSLDAQPAALTDSVSRNGFLSGMTVIVLSCEGSTEFLGREYRARATVTLLTKRALFYGHIRDLNIGILVVPLRGDAFEG